MFKPSKQIGPYTLVRKLGRGGFGEVWLAEKKSKFVTTKVAVKLPHDDQVDHETIAQEAKLWEQASGHPNVLPIIDADEYDGQVVIVSEYAPDGSLEQQLKEVGSLPAERAVELTIQILNGLEFLHSRNIIHRDLKPANVLLQGETARLADFGISRALRITATSQSTNVSGTFSYMPPESFDGERSVQTDIWSVGVNLYQFLTGDVPFPQRELSVLIAAIMMKDPAPLPDYVPQNLKHIISKALSKWPEDRFGSAKEMSDELRRFAGGETQTVIRASKSSFMENSNAAAGFEDEVETVVRPPKIFRVANSPTGIKPKNPEAGNLTGTVWKMEIHWGASLAATHYDYVRSLNIVLGMQKQTYSIGDLVLITDGFKVKAIVRVKDKPKRLTTNPAYSELFDKYGVYFDDWVTYAEADWLELGRGEAFEYRCQRGDGKVDLDEVKEKAYSLWANGERLNEKSCSICGIVYPVTEFTYGNRENRSYCKSCNKLEKAAYSRGGSAEARRFREEQRKVQIKPIQTFERAETLTVVSKGQPLIPFSMGPRFGFLDKNGELAIRPVYEDARLFSEDVAAVRFRGKWGFIDNSGTELVPPILDDVHSFNDGLARVNLMGRWTFIDKTGKELVPVSYECVSDFSEGFAKVRIGGFYLGFINRLGDLTVEAKYLQSYPYSNGLALVRETHRQKWWFINGEGKQAIKREFVSAESFSEGLAQVWLTEVRSFVDTKGVAAFVPPTGYKVQPFSCGLAKWTTGHPRFFKSGYFDQEGNAVIQVGAKCLSFAEDVAAVAHTGKWGFINKVGHLIIQDKYDKVCSFSDGLAVVQIQDKCGYVDKEGNEVIPLKYDHAQSFANDFALVTLNHRQFYIDKDGKEYFRT